MSNPDLSVVLGTWNRLPKLRDMLDSTRASIGSGIAYEIIVTDGGSTDGTLDYLREQADVKLIEHGELLGAIKAYADGAAAATGRYVVFSNDDLLYVGDTVARAYRFMLDNPEVGIGLFYTDRGYTALHLAQMPAHHADGTMTNVNYNGLVIFPAWIGKRLGWWNLENARSYGGDCYFVANCIEAGWSVVPIPGTHVRELVEEDELNRINSFLPEKQNGQHPDTLAYLAVYPRGPLLGNPRAFEAPPDAHGPLRILYAPIYERNHIVQHQQKYGLRKALQRYGSVWEVDYMATPDGADKLLDVAAQWRPDIVVTQCHYPAPLTPDHAQELRKLLPEAKIVCWSGDAYNIAANETYGADYLEMLSYFDLQLVVNAAALATYEQAGIRAAYWQNGIEGAGVGFDPLPSTPAHDVLFLGTGYNPERIALGRMLTALPYDVGIYGGEWAVNGIAAGANNTYDFEAGCRLYRNAKLTISIAEHREPATAFVSNRLFQAGAAGNVLILQEYVPQLQEYTGYVDGEHYIVWHDLDELESLIHYWLKPENAERRAAIAKAGTWHSLREHSFERRVAVLMDMLNNPSNTVPGVSGNMIGPEYA